MAALGLVAAASGAAPWVTRRWTPALLVVVGFASTAIAVGGAAEGTAEFPSLPGPHGTPNRATSPPTNSSTQRPGMIRAEFGARWVRLQSAPLPRGPEWSARGWASTGAVVLIGEGPVPTARAGDWLRVWGRYSGPTLPSGSHPGSLRVRRSVPPVIVRDASNSVSESMLSPWKRRVRLIDQSLPDKASGLLVAIGLGERGGVSTEASRLFAETGSSHLLALSGLHVGWFAFLVWWALRQALLRVPRLGPSGAGARMAAVVSALVVVLFAETVAPSASVTRAAAMAAIVFSAPLVLRRVDAASTLSAAWVLFALTEPLALLGPAAQLSFGAVTALVATGRRQPQDALSPRRSSPLRAAATATLVAHLATVPLTMHHFGQAVWLAPLANLIAIPIFGWLVLPACWLALACATLDVPALSEIAAAVFTSATELLIAWLQLCLRFCEASWTATLPAAIAVVGWGCAVGFARARGLRRLGWCVAWSAVLGGWLVTGGQGDGALHLTVIDVGHGDAILIEPPDGGAWLVDTGGHPGAKRPDFDGRRVRDELAARSIRELQAVILTHPDMDHIGGLQDLALHIGGFDVVYSGALAPTPRLLAGLATVQAGGGRLIEWRAPLEGSTSGLTWRVLHPRTDSPCESRNDCSLVLELSFGHTRALLTGDIEQSAERELVESGRLRSVDVLKVAHHGSKTSSSEQFLDATRPRAAILSTNERARYGLPDEEVLSRLESRGVELWRTDRQGTVRVTSDGTSWWVTTEK